MNPTLLLMVDAGRHDYIKQMPFLNSFKERGLYVKKLKSTHGYAERTPLFTGFEATHHGYFGNFHLSKKSPFSWLKFIKISGTSKKYQKIRKILSILTKYISGYHFTNLYNIPFYKLHKFNIQEDQAPLYKKNRYKLKSIFDILRDNKKTFSFIDGIENPFKRHLLKIDLTELIIKSFNKKRDFYYSQIVDLDNLGHKYGPSSKKFKKVLKQTDQKIKKIILKFLKKYPQANIIIFGDHGMTDVKQSVDIIKKLPKGIEYFVDSTSIRIWCKNKKPVINILKKIPQGKIISKKQRKKYKIDLKREAIGDILFYLDEGTVFFPDYYYSEKRIKGMHGYLNGKDMDGFLIAIGKNIKKQSKNQAHLTDILPTIIKLMNLKTNIKFPGTNLLSQKHK